MLGKDRDLLKKLPREVRNSQILQGALKLKPPHGREAGLSPLRRRQPCNGQSQAGRREARTLGSLGKVVPGRYFGTMLSQMKGTTTVHCPSGYEDI